MATIRKDFIPGPATVVGQPNTNDPYICDMREVLTDDEKDPTNITIWRKPENGRQQTNFIVDIEEIGKEALKREWVDADGEHHDKGERVSGFNYTRVGVADTRDQALDLAEGKLERSLRDAAADTAVEEIAEAVAEETPTEIPAEAEVIEETQESQEPEGELALVSPQTADTVRQGGNKNKKKHGRK